MRKDRGFARMLDLDTKRAPYEICYLVTQIQTIKSEIDRLEKALVENPRKIQERQAVLSAMQLVLDQHPAGVTQDQIGPVKRKATSTLPYGQATKFIFRTLREANGKALSTFAVTMEVARHAGLQPTRDEFKALRRTVLSALNSLRVKGLLYSPEEHVPGSNVEALWGVVAADDEAE